MGQPSFQNCLHGRHDFPPFSRTLLQSRFPLWREVIDDASPIINRLAPTDQVLLSLQAMQDRIDASFAKLKAALRSILDRLHDLITVHGTLPQQPQYKQLRD